MDGLYTNSSARKDFFQNAFGRYGTPACQVNCAVAFFTTPEPLLELAQSGCRINLIIRLGYPTHPKALDKLLGVEGIKIRFLTDMDAWAATHMAAGQAILFCGDLNVARTDMDIHPRERKVNQVGARPDERALIERLLSRGLVDVGRTLHPHDDALFTWWAPWRNLKQRNIGWRIDYVVASSALAAHAETCVVQREFGTSDHGPVVATFA